MKRIIFALLTTVTIVVLLFGYNTSTMGVMVGQDTVISGSAATPQAQQAVTVTGPSVATEWGPVQVEITVTGSEVSDVQVLQYPNSNPKDQQINAYALPILVDETLQAQDANISMVSGATVTSVGYLQSLQAALDEAGL
ncbi:MAG: FMN-binding protein [Candidatus Nanopelagicales bacterium]|jgi:uncharacterized protein with FMN-binding domain|nr:FMN-binding protein [Candidatus Nanopelagicales bacterium]MCU0299232.1 FMN-binding protein [Candidatus Nanopelagicales bacterium]